ncbi:MAG: glucose-6-phosphate isomerase [Alphaproteobacteria bacterium]|nr:glucose-6-phosphate isomerase [Alphaproteobacteria bacterium]
MRDLFLTHPGQSWAFDLTAASLTDEEIDRLEWNPAFAEMEGLEAGNVANPDEGRQVGHYWLRSPERAPTVAQGTAIGTTRDAVLEFALGVRTGEITAPDGERFTDVIHIGIGGSALGPQLLVDALGDDVLRMHFVDNTDPDGIARVLADVGSRLRHALVVAVSKSGGTAETANGVTLVRRAVEAAGLEVGGRFVAITGKGSLLDHQAIEEGWLARFEMWDWVGGRTSITSAVGLLPGALAGVDMRELLDGAAAMDDWTRAASWRENPAAMLAGAWHVLGRGRGERAMVVLPYCDRLVLFSRYLQQLVMESLGKKEDLAGNVVHQGLAVYGNKGSTDQHSFVQQLRDGRNDFFAVLVQVLSDGMGDSTPVDGVANTGDFLQGFLLGTRRALHESDRPTVTITVPKLDASVLGALIALFERAVGLYASLVGINAYHQPGVEAGKKAAKEILALNAAVQQALGKHPQTLEAIHDTVGGDRTEIWYILHRLARTGRAVSTGEGWKTA